MELQYLPIKVSFIYERSLSVTIPEELKQPKVTVVVLEFEDDEAKIINEIIQQEDDGSINLPVAKCEFAIRRISYNYEEQVTHRWGENAKKGLIWTVNITKPGVYNVLSEDNGNDDYVFELRTPSDTLDIEPKGNLGEMTQKNHGTIQINKEEIITISAFPKALVGMSSRFKFKGLKLIPVK